MFKKVPPSSVKHFILALASIAVLGIWLYFTPPGLLGKLDAIAYAVCHRIPLRSFFLADRQMPLCARCTGMYLGAFFSFLILFPRGRRAAFPGRGIMILLGIFVAAFAVDGTNSLAASLNAQRPFLPGPYLLYQPHNWLRLVTGTGMGLAIPAVLMPIFHATIWTEPVDRPILGGWKDAVLMIALGALGVLAALSGNPLLLYPIAVITPLTVVFILTLTYAVLWVMILKRENHYHTWLELWPILLTGFLTTMIQISLFDLVRFALTHVWTGFGLPD
ncbi:MAG TPA: DUF2085 domain-containing protein [Longilinea sp.]|nr:DUF2085 domain-containing protein [Longilinea sp.]